MTTNQITVIDEVRSAITKMTPQFALALPSHISPEKFQRVAITAIQNNPKLLQADRKSLYGACMKAAQDGLLPDGREAALVDFGGNISYMPMIAGVLKKVRQSGELASIHASVIYENDKFRYWVDSDGQHLEHEPILFCERGKAIGAYAMAKTKDGSLTIQALSHADIEKIRNASRSKTSGPWLSWWEEMAKKSALRRLAKYLPQSTDLEHSLHADDELFEPAEQQQSNVVELQPTVTEEKPKRKSRLDKVKEAATPHDAQTGEVIENTIPGPDYNPGEDRDEDVI